jgi:choline kinase
MKAIILSAGQGRRLMPLTESIPKCCLRLEGKSMLEWQIDTLAATGVEEVVVVTGFGSAVVENVISRIRGIPVRTLFNPFYSLSDNLGTCWLARGEMNAPFVLINGDTLFELAVIKRLLDGDHAQPITLVADRKNRYDEDDMKIIADGERLLHVGKRLDTAQVNGESIGMMLFSQTGADAFVRRVEQLMSGVDGLTRWYLSAIDDLAQAGQVGICSIHGLSWCEVDNLADLEHAGNVVQTWRSKMSTADTCRLQAKSTRPNGLRRH